MTDDQLTILAERFCAAPLPYTVCADHAATLWGSGRTGTNLLTVDEAKAVLAYVMVDPLGGKPPVEGAVPAGQFHAFAAALLDEVAKAGGDMMKALRAAAAAGVAYDRNGQAPMAAEAEVPIAANTIDEERWARIIDPSWWDPAAANLSITPKIQAMSLEAARRVIATLASVQHDGTWGRS